MKEDITMLDTVAMWLDYLQTILTIAVTLGLTHVVRGAWSRATRAQDERLLLQVTAHERAMERVEQIRQSDRAKDTAGPDTVNDLAKELERQADNSLRYAIADTKWRTTAVVPRIWGVIMAAVGFSVWIMTLAGYISFTVRAPQRWASLRQTLFWTSVGAEMITLLGLGLLTLGRTIWRDSEVKRMRGSDRGDAVRTRPTD